MKINYTAGIFLLSTIVLFSNSCGSRLQERPISRTGVPIGVSVDLPSEIKNAESDSAVLKETAFVVSVPLDETFYIGSEQLARDQPIARLSERLETLPAGINVYIAAGFSVDYLNVVKILDTARREGVHTIGLIVERKSREDPPSIFKIQVKDEPDPELPLKPDPLALVISIGANDKVQLNKEPMGDPMDTAKLVQTLTQVFQQRPAHEKAVVIKPQRSTKYGQVVRMIDAAKGTGANPIILQIDDLFL